MGVAENRADDGRATGREVTVPAEHDQVDTFVLCRLDDGITRSSASEAER